MLVVPLGREGGFDRRAWVTYTLVALNVLCFVLFSIGTSDRERGELLRSWRATASYLEDRPYLRVPHYIAPLMPAHLRERVPKPDPAVEEWQVAKEQMAVHEMATELRKLHIAGGDIGLAYIPAIGAPHTIVTSMFLHGGLMHLAGNMLFLLAVAPFVEDAYGKVLFIVLYLSGGIVATLAFAARSPNLFVPLVGASGAIAAVMGAYLVRFALSRLRFLFIPILILPMWNFRFSAPALVVLPIWFLEQIVSIPTEGGSGVAVTAHVAGFAYGLAVAALLKVTGLVKRLSSQPAPAAPARNIATANVPAADTEALRRELDVALFREDPPQIDAAGARLLSAYVAARHSVPARALVLELEPLTERQLLPQFLPLAAAFAERSGDRPLAILLYRRLCDSDAPSTNVVPSLVKLANLLRSKGDLAGAKETLSRALRRPDCSDEWRRKIESTLAVFNEGV